MAFWIIGGAILMIALLASSGKRTNASGSRQEDSHWIYHPHVIILMITNAHDVIRVSAKKPCPAPNAEQE